MMKRVSIIDVTVWDNGEVVTYTAGPDEVTTRSEAQLHRMLADALSEQSALNRAVENLRKLLKSFE